MPELIIRTHAGKRTIIIRNARLVEDLMGHPIINGFDPEGRARSAHPDACRRLCGDCTTRLDRGQPPRRNCRTCDKLTLRRGPHG